MAWPLPSNYPITTAYGKAGWSCGFHTGCDMAAPHGTDLYAAIAGEIRHRYYGSAFGSHQFAISPDPDQPFGDGEVFYAHASKRIEDGARVDIGDYVGEVGSEGQSTGPHLHFEYHPQDKNVWNCSACANPQIVLDHAAGPSVPQSDPWSYGDVYQAKLVPGENGNSGEGSDSVRRMQTVLNSWSFSGGQDLPITGYYGPDTQHEVGLFQEQVCGDPPDGAIGPKQTDVLFGKLGPWNLIR